MDTRRGKLAFGIAVAGFAASVIVHATALLTAHALPPAVIYALLAGVAVSGLLASMVAPRPASPPEGAVPLRHDAGRRLCACGWRVRRFFQR